MEDSGIESDPKQPTTTFLSGNSFVKLTDSDSSPASSGGQVTPRKATARELRRKLERRIEQARKSHKAQEYKKGPSLIPIQRLPIPSTKIISAKEKREQQPLVEWESDDSDDDLPVNFFPSAKDKAARQELTDTFSIEEMEMSPEEDEDLNLEPPKQALNNWCCFQMPTIDWKCHIL
ncbi:protein FAM219A [Neocloeon triangulifer]|uniref:protein FAM219A n=1 Tax=Neocloeon triangulifer TaxID=2078957 RepID=UPI00286F41FD|nr:protein FAM219A [Neocloeon triangulifer]